MVCARRKVLAIIFTFLCCSLKYCKKEFLLFFKKTPTTLIKTTNSNCCLYPESLITKHCYVNSNNWVMLILSNLCRFTQQIKEVVHGFCRMNPKYGILPNPPWYCNKFLNQKSVWEEESELEGLVKLFQLKDTKLMVYYCFESLFQKSRQFGRP